RVTRRGAFRLVAAGLIGAFVAGCGALPPASDQPSRTLVASQAFDPAATDDDAPDADAASAEEAWPDSEWLDGQTSDATRAQGNVIDPRAVPVQPFHTRNVPPDRLVIPSIGVDARVVEIGVHYDRTGSLVWDTAPFAVGHHQGTAFPGEVGNVVLSGHISSPNEGDVFRHLPNLKMNDGVVVMTSEQPYLYRVADIKVMTPDAVQVLDRTPTQVLTLITCVPDGIYSHRLVVRA